MGNENSKQPNTQNFVSRRRDNSHAPNDDNGFNYYKLGAAILGGVALAGAAVAVGVAVTNAMKSEESLPSQRQASQGVPLPREPTCEPTFPYREDMVGAAGFSVAKAIENKQSSISMQEQVLQRNYCPSEPNFPYRENAIMAVDATPGCGGGVLILYLKKEVYYYSLDWSRHLQFPERSDIFEMTNAYIAMTLWQSELENPNINTLTIKGDNTVFGRRTTGGNDKYWNRIVSLRNSIGATWEHVSCDDPDLKLADALSRKKFTDMDLTRFQESDGWNIFPVMDRAMLTLRELISEKQIPKEYFT